MADEVTRAPSMLQRHSWVWPTLVAIALVFAAWEFGIPLLGSVQDASDSSAVKELQLRVRGMQEPEKGVSTLVVAMFNEYRDITRNWSAIYNGCVLGAAALGLIAGLVLKLESIRMTEARKKDVAAFLASAGAILAALSASGDFQMKWQVNRAAAADVEAIAFDILSPSPRDTPKTYALLRQIAEDRHNKLIGNKGAAQKPGRPEALPVSPQQPSPGQDPSRSADKSKPPASK